MEEATMPRVKQASRRKRVTKAAVPALGAAGLTFSLVGGASASAVPTDVQQTNNYLPSQAFTLGEEEIADVSLATFHLFDKDTTGAVRGGAHLAWGSPRRRRPGCRRSRGRRSRRGRRRPRRGSPRA